jgi:glutamate-1-semialdehyde 2,1-aminomutase
MGSIGREPAFLARGEGAFVFDVDGRRYVDLVSSWGPLICGHARREVVEAATEAARLGTGYGAPTEGELELALELTERVPSAEMVRMTSSGTEAAMSAIRLARAATGRETVVKFAGGYHGHSDGLLAQAGSGLATAGQPASPGVTIAQAEDTSVVSWNDREQVERAVKAAQPAAIICEPYAANMGLVLPDADFLSFLRSLCDQTQTLLIFDEVITGFRVARGGAQERENVLPDITVLGKIVGGGLPAAAYGGRRELMEQVAPQGPVYQAGTLAGNPVAVASGLATLRLLDGAAYVQLEATTAQLARGLASAAQSAGVDVSIPWVPGLLSVFFSSDPVRDYEGASRCDTSAYAAFCNRMLDSGINIPPSQYEAWFPSLAHEQTHIDLICEAAVEAFARL